MTNEHRGEVTVKLETPSGPLRPFTLRTTWEALAEIEELTGQAFVPLARQIYAGSVGIKNTTAIVYAGLKAGGTHLRYDDVADMVFRTGLADEDLLSSLGKFVEYAMTGGRDEVDDLPDDSEDGFEDEDEDEEPREK